MKLTILKIHIALLVLSNSLCGQNLSVDYNITNNGQQWQASLLTNDSESNWIEDPPSTSETSMDAPFLLKKYSKDVIYLRDFIFTQPFYIEDSLHKMIWNLTNDSKTILQEKCHSAKTFFRGRMYTAYYSNRITNSDGPWKFGGLPGLILAIASDDNMYSWTAVKIIKNYKSEKVKSQDITKYKFIGWNDYVSKFAETIDKWAKQIKSDGSIQPGTTIKLKIDAPEIIYPKAQQGEGISIDN